MRQRAIVLTLVGAVISTLVLRRRLGGLGGQGVARYAVRLAVAVLVSTGLALGLRELMPALSSDASVIDAFFQLVLLGGVAVLAYLAAARALRLDEVAAVLATVLRRTRSS